MSGFWSRQWRKTKNAVKDAGKMMVDPTGALGINDASYTEALWGKSADDINDEYNKSVEAAQNKANETWQQGTERLETATKRDDGTDRTVASSLNAYDQNAKNITEGLSAEKDAGKNTQEFLNPYSDYANKQITQNVQGSAGAALQSSGTQNAIASGVANATANQWNTANQQALANSQNNQQLLTSQQNINQQTLNNDVLPEQDIINRGDDMAYTQLETATAAAERKANTDAQDKGVFGNVLDAAGAVAPFLTV